MKKTTVFARSLLGTLALVAWACGAPGGGGGGGGTAATGGAAGSPCDAATQTVGCYVAVSPAQRVHCGADGKWAVDGACNAGDLCQETWQGSVKVTSCVASGQTNDVAAGDSSGTGDDAAADTVADAPSTDVATGPVCGDGACQGNETDVSCPADCQTKAVCGNGKCETGEAPQTCGSDCKPDCQPNCAGKQCGPDSCGGLCAQCGEGKACTDAGQCVPIGAICGNGKCEGGENYTSCPADCPCEPQCVGKKCGPDGCGNTCGSCDSATTCSSTGQCVPKAASCGNGTCESGESYASCPNDCPCVPQCAGKKCGPDGCGTTCGTCDSASTCSSAGLCEPKASLCGNGTCDSGETTTTCPNDCSGNPSSCVGHCQAQAPGGCWCDTACTSSGDCCSDYKAVCMGTCTPTCSGKSCGATDGCGGTCSGTCPAGQVCSVNKICVTPNTVCGNGVCETGETASNCAKDCGTSAKTCKGLCGKAGIGGCYCDTVCAKNGDCCPDYNTYCGTTSSVCPNGTCEAGETAANCPADCKTGCFGDFTLGKTFYTSNDTKQLGMACNPTGAPKNCPDGDWIDFGAAGDCICIVSCAALGLTLGQSCTTDGAWQCQAIQATNASANGGQFCVPTKWGLCQK